jgi:vacuolar-type H+-ATPase subunit F/Vma7
MAQPPLPSSGSEAEAVWVLGDAPTVRGFRLAGVAGMVVGGEAEARAALARLRQEGAALVIVTESVAEALGGPEALVSGGVQPLVVAVPSAREPVAGANAADHLAQRVQRALGLSAGRRA